MKSNQIKTHLYQAFLSEEERDLVIYSIGYDDFKVVKPIKTPYVRSRYVLHYVFRGSGKLFVNGVEHPVRAKQFFYIPKGIPTYYYPNVGDEWAYMWFDVGGELDEYYLGSVLNAKSPVYSVSKSFDESVLWDLVRDCNDIGKTGYFKVKSAFFRCVDELVIEGSFPSPVSVLVKDATSFIDMNYTDCDFSVQDISNALHVSHSYLSRIYREHTGETLSFKVKSRRLKKAGELLSKTFMSAKEVGYKVGYRDDVHFLKEFKKYYGMTTKEYKAQKSLEN